MDHDRIIQHHPSASFTNTPAILYRIKGQTTSAALKLIEKEGGKNIIFSYNETESYRVTASIRQKTELEAIGTVLNGIPFICKEREEYFAIQKKGRDIRITEIRGQVTNERMNRCPTPMYSY